MIIAAACFVLLVVPHVQSPIPLYRKPCLHCYGRCNVHLNVCRLPLFTSGQTPGQGTEGMSPEGQDANEHLDEDHSSCRPPGFMQHSAAVALQI